MNQNKLALTMMTRAQLMPIFLFSLSVCVCLFQFLCGVKILIKWGRVFFGQVVEDGYFSWEANHRKYFISPWDISIK